jgi:hypothetical protein
MYQPWEQQGMTDFQTDSPTGAAIDVSPTEVLAIVPPPPPPEGLLSPTEGLISPTEPLTCAELEAMH